MRGPGVYAPRPLFYTPWYAACFASEMLNMLTAPALTFLFLGVVVGLGTAFVWLFWEMEQPAKPRRNGPRGR